MLLSMGWKRPARHGWAQNTEMNACVASVCSSLALCSWRRRHTRPPAVDSGEVRWWWRRAVKKTSELELRVLELEDEVLEAAEAFEELQRTQQQVRVRLSRRRLGRGQRSGPHRAAFEGVTVGGDGDGGARGKYALSDVRGEQREGEAGVLPMVAVLLRDSVCVCVCVCVQ